MHFLFEKKTVLFKEEQAGAEKLTQPLQKCSSDVLTMSATCLWFLTLVIKLQICKKNMTAKILCENMMTGEEGHEPSSTHTNYT